MISVRTGHLRAQVAQGCAHNENLPLRPADALMARWAPVLGAATFALIQLELGDESTKSTAIGASSFDAFCDSCALTDVP